MIFDRHESEVITAAKIAICAVLVLAAESAAFASRVPPSDYLTEGILNNYFEYLGRIKQICGRYPTTEEGIGSILSKPPSMICPSNAAATWNFPVGWDHQDGWHVPIQFTSDSRTFRIEASHGYFVTDHSPEHSPHSAHWENPNGGASWPPPFGCPSWLYFYFEATALLVGILGVVGRIIVGRQHPTVKRFFLVPGVISLALFLIGLVTMPF